MADIYIKKLAGKKFISTCKEYPDVEFEGNSYEEVRDMMVRYVKNEEQSIPVITPEKTRSQRVGIGFLA